MTGSEKAVLILADGEIFEGRAFGSTGCVTGEAVFTTGMTGYLETLTDPSYFGQIITQTFPLIGNYGVIPRDFESAKIHCRGYIARSFCGAPSNFRSEGVLEDFLKANGVVGLCGIDTRRLTKVLRESGVMNAMIASGASDEARAAFRAIESGAVPEALLQRIRAYKIERAVESVSLAARAIEQSADEIFEQSAAYRAVPVTKDGLKVNDERAAMARGRGRRVVLWDFGAKGNIRRELLKRGLEVVTVPYNATAAEILAEKPDGIMLSNGPGDPADNTSIIEEIRTILADARRVPMFGICLGHQMLALAAGARTAKLKYGHRGANQPVKDLASGRVYISSQNHGYAVENESLPHDAVLSFVNTNDGTCEGITYTRYPAFSVQFHPEACAGPLDTNFLFDEFISLMDDKDFFKDYKANFSVSSF